MRKQNNVIMRLINKMHIVEDEAQLHDFLTAIAAPDKTRPVTVSFLNAHALNVCYKNPEFLQSMMDSDYVLRDGIGIKIALRLLGRHAGLNMNGTDLIPHILRKFKSKKASLFGTRRQYLNIAAKKISTQNVEVVDIVDGFQADTFYTHAAATKPADLIILAMGMPKQERLAAQLMQEINHPSVIICGGAILDFMSGKVKRAPLIFRKYGMEWFYRLMQEPRRLFKRYVIGNFIMLYHAVQLVIFTKYEKARAI